MTSLTRMLTTGVALLALSAPAAAQAPPEGSSPAPSAPSAQAPASYPIHVKVARKGEPLKGVAVFLRAARVKGPFEPKDPKPEWEATALTTTDGVATFAAVPRALGARGLKLHAVVVHEGMTFKSAPVTPTSGLRLSVPIFERGADLSALQATSLRTIVEPWEDYLVFTQIWTLGVTGDTALDTSLLAAPGYEAGLPLELPLKAQGIQVMSAEGQAKTVNSTVSWQGVVRPGQPVTLQMRYSIPVKSETFVYEQPLAIPVKSIQIIIPLETRYTEKLPRLNGLELRPVGFAPEDIKSGYGIPGLRPDKEFLYAQRDDVPAGTPLLFQLDNLPYGRERAPYIALAIGVLGALLVLILSFVSVARAGERVEQIEELLGTLRQERDALLTHLSALKREVDAGKITEREYEAEEAPLRGRAAIILSKIEELEARVAGTAS